VIDGRGNKIDDKMGDKMGIRGEKEGEGRRGV
jgi:hypothetical protein